MSFRCFFIVVLVTFRGPDVIKCQNIKEKIELFGSSQLRIMLGDRRLHENASCEGAGTVGFPLIPDFNITFQYLIVKSLGFTCIFNVVKFESCMSLKLALTSGFQS